MTSSSVESRNAVLLSNIESFMNDAAYRDIIENAASYNTRLRIERKMRMPFLDAHTGVAQNHSNLFMSSRQRMPGLCAGQLYTYPAKRWRKKRRQYLLNFMQPKRKEVENDPGDIHVVNAVENPSLAINEDSKDSTGSKDEIKVPDPWYYEELEMQDIEGFDEPDPDSDYDYEDSYTKKRKKRAAAKSAKGSFTESPMKRSVKSTIRGRRKGPNYTPDYSDTDKPYYCDLCGARYKTRPGLTYHYTHSHKEKNNPSQDEDTSLDGPPSSPSVVSKDKIVAGHYAGPSSTPDGSPILIGTRPSTPSAGGSGRSTPAGPILPASVPQSLPQPDVSNAATWGKFHDSTYMPYSGVVTSPAPAAASNNGNKKGAKPAVSQPPASLTPPTIVDEESSSATSESDKKDDLSKESSPAPVLKMDEKEKAKPSPYCDFCLGNEESNKKSGQPEELVSCSDCGRSGHPSCLQFTPNMIVSVRKYRWQCIECKCCSICGTSDNDDQLLFCDDCDRGYHMYCLDPPLATPPEGSWSCKLCIEEFH